MMHLTKAAVDELAIRFSRLFHGPTIVGGPKNRTYRLAMSLLTSLAFSTVIGVIVSVRWPEHIVIPGVVALLLELVTLLVLKKGYEPQFREVFLRKEGILGSEEVYDHKNIEHYKSVWLNNHFPANPASYIEIVGNLRKIKELGDYSKATVRTRGERLVDYLLTFRFARSIFTIGFIALVLKIFDFMPEMKARITPMFDGGFEIAAKGFFIAFFVLLTSGMVAVVVSAIWARFRESRHQKCSPQSLDSLTQALLRRAIVSVEEYRLGQLSDATSCNVLPLVAKKSPG